MRKVIAYIDGFNLYHAINELDDESLKWLNLFSLCQSIIGEHEQLVEVKYFTAYATWHESAYRNHQRYVSALETKNVQVVLGRFKKKYITCKAKCGRTFTTHEEKETDVNIGVHLVADSIRKRFDRAIIISADTDLKAAIQMAQKENPDCSINVVAPPKRKKRARDLKPLFEITKGRLRTNQLEEKVKLKTGKTIQRPQKWAKSQS